jgi:site-specific DNA-methyltransferase (adenine-specific)
MTTEAHAVLTGDCRELLDTLPARAARLVITDPPYNAAGTLAFREAMPAIARRLAPGGSLVVLCGSHQMPEVLAAAAGELRYWWIGGMSAQAISRIFGKEVKTRFKPALWFVAGTLRRTGRAPLDLHHGRYKGDKRHHPHGQPAEWFANWIEALTEPGELVIDPFAGAGAVAVAARSLGRASISIELDPRHAQTISQRLAASSGPASPVPPIIQI